MTANCRISKGMVVEMVYTMRDENGAIVDRKDPDDPAFFIYGHNQVLPLIEAAIDGQTEGFLKIVHIPCSQAFGNKTDKLVYKVPVSNLPEGAVLGERFQMQLEGERTVAVAYVGNDGDKALLDGNHPLAGKDLEVDLRILSVRESTPEELEKGEVSPQTVPSRILH